MQKIHAAIFFENRDAPTPDYRCHPEKIAPRPLPQAEKTSCLKMLWLQLEMILFYLTVISKQLTIVLEQNTMILGQNEVGLLQLTIVLKQNEVGLL